jgi:microcin C transport system ATP-binding protein
MTDTPHPILTLCDLTLSLNTDSTDSTQPIIEDVSITLHKNETFALVGESGSGKSIIAKSILQLLPRNTFTINRGRITFNDGKQSYELLKSPLNVLQNIRGNEISIIFQDSLSSLNPLHTIQKQLIEVITQHNTDLSHHAIKEHCESLLTQVKLTQTERILSSYPHQLSGGQRQRILIAMAIANKPKILIADEPTTALDATTQQDILDLLASLKASLNMSILLITHDLHIVKHYADRVAVIHRGHIIETNTFESIYTQPKSDYTRALLHTQYPSKTPITSTDSPSIFSAKNLTVFTHNKTGLLKPKQKKNLIEDVNFTLCEQETLGIIGESGSGKSSLALGLLNLLDYEGDTFLHSHKVNWSDKRKIKHYRKSIQIIFQDPLASLSPRMSVYQIIAEGLMLHESLCESELQQQVIALAIDVGIEEHLLNRYPHELSGGQCQRIAIARALILKPKVLILDEPTSALDKSIEIQILQLLKTLQIKHKLTYIFITHDLHLIRKMSDKIIVLESGFVIEEGHTEQVFNQPQSTSMKKMITACLM